MAVKGEQQSWHLGKKNLLGIGEGWMLMILSESLGVLLTKEVNLYPKLI